MTERSTLTSTDMPVTTQAVLSHARSARRGRACTIAPGAELVVTGPTYLDDVLNDEFHDVGTLTTVLSVSALVAVGDRTEYVTVGLGDVTLIEGKDPITGSSVADDLAFLAGTSVEDAADEADKLVAALKA